MWVGGAYFFTVSDHQRAVKMLWSHSQTVTMSPIFISISWSHCTNSLLCKLKVTNLGAYVGYGYICAMFFFLLFTLT